MKKLLVIALTLIITGGVCIVGAFASVDWEISRLDVIKVEPKAFTTENEVTTVRVNNYDGMIELIPADTFSVEYKESELYSYAVSETDGTVELTCTRLKKQSVAINFPFSDHDRNSVAVYVPACTRSIAVSNRNASVAARRLTVDSLEIKSTNGSVYIDGVTATGNIKAETTNASMRMEQTAAAEMRLATSNGAIQVDDVTARSLTATTTNGCIEIENAGVAGMLSADTTNARIETEQTTAETIWLHTTNAGITAEEVTAQQLTADTTNGSIRGQLDAYSMWIKTSNAEISLSVPGNRADYRLDISSANGSSDVQSGGDGGRYLQAHTSGSRVKIKFSGSNR